MPSCENVELALPPRGRRRIELEPDQQTFRTTDPILLHQPHFVRPTLESIKRVQQFLGEMRNLEKPLGQLALLNDRARSPAAPVNDLLVCEDGPVDRVPVHLRFFALHESRAHKIKKHSLLVLVVAWIARCDLAPPVKREPHRLELSSHRGDVVVGPGARMYFAFHGGILGWHAERVPAHRVQDIEPPGALVTRDNVPHRIVAHVTHVDPSGRIWEHLQHVVAWARVVVAGREDAALVPYLLPTEFRLSGVVALSRH